MGKKTKKIGPAGGLGARYGVSVRRRYIEIVTTLRKKYRCPQCGSNAVQRESVGVWLCKKCGFKFTGGAYQPRTKLGMTAERAARSR